MNLSSVCTKMLFIFTCYLLVMPSFHIVGWYFQPLSYKKNIAFYYKKAKHFLFTWENIEFEACKVLKKSRVKLFKKTKSN